jgi:hypothetical protein
MIHFIQTFMKQNTEIILQRHCKYTKNVILLKQNTEIILERHYEYTENVY